MINHDPKKIINIVAKEFHVTPEEIINPTSHKHNITDARHVSMYIVKLKNPDLSETAIDSYFKLGYRCFRNATGIVQGLLKTDKVFRLRFEICILLINTVKRVKPTGRPKKIKN